MESTDYSGMLITRAIDNDCYKLFLSNLDGRINTEDVQRFFSAFGPIEHIESWTHKSAVIVYADLDSLDRCVAAHRKCTINQQEIFIRRFRYGYIERPYMDSSVLFVKPKISDLAIEWNEQTLRQCFHAYEQHIEHVRVVPTRLQALVYFKDYDFVDQILLQTSRFRVDGVSIEMKRAKRSTAPSDDDQRVIERLLDKNRDLRKQIERTSRMSTHLCRTRSLLGEQSSTRHEIKSLKCKISQLKGELALFSKRRHRH